MKFRWALFRFACMLAACAGPSFADESPPRLSAHVCVGYDPDSRVWGAKSSWSAESGGWCAAGQGAVAAAQMTPSSTHLRPDDTPLSIFCCPLPEGILTARHRIVTGRCPENSIVTGVGCDAKKPVPAGANLGCRFVLRCTDIDETRFELGPAEDGLRVEPADDTVTRVKDRLFPWREDARILPRISLARIPVAARYGIGRIERSRWEIEAVVGRPVGAMLSEVRGNLDSDLFFRELRFKQDAKSGAEAKGVEIFPWCRALSDPFSPAPECVP